MADNDSQLVRRTLEGETDAFGELVERYRRLVHGVLLERVRRPDEVEDLVQETFCRAYEGLGSLRDRRHFGTWLLRIAGSLALDWWRRREVRERQVTQQTTLQLYPLPPSPADDLERRDMSAYVWAAVDRLSADLRRTVVLYYVEDCRVAEIARFLGISRATVKWRLHQARRRLGDELGAALRTGAEQERAQPSEGELRERILAGLPLLAVRMRREPGGGWGWWAAYGAGAAAIVGLAAVVAVRGTQHIPDPRVQVDGVSGMRVRRAEVRLPTLSTTATPRAPRPGQVVTVRAAGPALDEADATPELHYLESIWSGKERTVPMRRDGDAWVARVAMPADAPGLSYFVSPVTTGPDTSIGRVELAWRSYYARFDHHVHAADPSPYLRIGRQLSHQSLTPDPGGWQHPADPALACRVLEAGVARATEARIAELFRPYCMTSPPDAARQEQLALDQARLNRQGLHEALAAALLAAGHPAAAPARAEAGLAVPAATTRRDDLPLPARLWWLRAKALEELGRNGEAAQAYAAADSAATWWPVAREGVLRVASPEPAAALLERGAESVKPFRIHDVEGREWTREVLAGQVVVIAYDPGNPGMRSRVRRLDTWLRDLGVDGVQGFYVSGRRPDEPPQDTTLRFALDETGLYEALGIERSTLLVLDGQSRVRVRRWVGLYGDDIRFVDLEALGRFVRELAQEGVDAIVAQKAGDDGARQVNSGVVR